MELLRLFVLSAALAALPVLASAEAEAQQRLMSGARTTFPSHGGKSHGGGKHDFHGTFGDRRGGFRDCVDGKCGGFRNRFGGKHGFDGKRGGFHDGFDGRHGFDGGFGGVFIAEREIPVIVEVESDSRPAELPAAAAPPPPPKKPYVIGRTYASLPGGCMKMIEEGVSYYYCTGGEWYRQLGGGRGGPYRAVVKP